MSLSAPVSYPVPTIKCLGLIDSGADITVIPQSIARQLKLRYVDEIPVMGYDGIPKKVFVYSAKIILGNLGTLIIRTISSELDYALIGRDILNQWSAFLKGRDKILELS